MIDAPLSDKAMTKLSGYFVRDDGYSHLDSTGARLNDERGQGARLDLRLRPTDAVTWDVAADYTHADDLLVIDSHNFLNPGPRVVFSLGLNKGETPQAPYLANRKKDFTLGNDVGSAALASTIDVDFGGERSLVFVTGARRNTQKYARANPSSFRLGPTSGTFSDGEYEQITQEVVFRGPLARDIWLVAGVSYLHEKNSDDLARFTLDRTLFTAFSTVVSRTDSTLKGKTDAGAVFADVEVRPIEHLTLGLGVRFTDERKILTITPNAVPAPPPQNVAPLFLRVFTTDISGAGRQHSQIYTPRFTASYQFSPDVMFYASVGRGYTAAGWDTLASGDLNARGGVRPETAWSYEAGIKALALAETLRLNVTAFSMTVKDRQVSEAPRFIAPSPFAVAALANAADLRSQGVEAELAWQPLDGLSIVASAGVLDARYKNPNADVMRYSTACKAGGFADPLCGAGLLRRDGEFDRPSLAPRTTAAVGLSYDWPLAAGYALTPAIQIALNEGTARRIGMTRPTAEQVDTSLNFGPTDGDWSLAFVCENCAVWPRGPHAYSLDEPARWAVRARFNL